MAIEVTVAVLVAVLVAVAVVVGVARDGAARDGAGVFMFPPFLAAAAAWSCSVSMVTDLAWPELSLTECLERDAFLKDGLDIFGSGMVAAMVASCLARISCAEVTVLWVIVSNDAVEGDVMATETDKKTKKKKNQKSKSIDQRTSGLVKEI